VRNNVVAAFNECLREDLADGQYAVSGFAANFPVESTIIHRTSCHSKQLCVSAEVTRNTDLERTTLGASKS
jgi:hypothetical protein